MLKKILVGAAALGLTAAVLANGKTAISAGIPASEFNPGIYLGVQAGLGESNWKNGKSGYNDFKVSDDTGLAVRIFAGYDFTKYWAAEVGYTYFGSKTKIKNATTTLSDISTQAFDLVGKGKIPVVDRFDVYGKAGIGYVVSSGINKGAVENAYYIGSHDQQNNFGVLLGMGAEYYFTPSLWMDLSWTRTILRKGFGETASTYYSQYQPDPDFYALGIAYKFNI